MSISVRGKLDSLAEWIASCCQIEDGTPQYGLDICDELGGDIAALEAQADSGRRIIRLEEACERLLWNQLGEHLETKRPADQGVVDEAKADRL